MKKSTKCGNKVSIATSKKQSAKSCNKQLIPRKKNEIKCTKPLPPYQNKQQHTARHTKRVRMDSVATKNKKPIFELHTPNVRRDVYDCIEKKIASVLSGHLNTYMSEMEKRLDIQFQLLREKVYSALVESKCNTEEIFQQTLACLPDIPEEK